MYIILPLLLITAVASGKHFILKYRLDLGFPVSILDFLLVLGIVMPCLPLPRNRFAAPVHKAVPRALMLYLLAMALAGIVTMLADETHLYTALANLRNYLTVPAAVIVGYWMLNQPKHIRWYTFWYVIAGALTAIMIMLFFRDRGEEVSRQSFDINLLRSMDYGPAIAGIAATFVIYQLTVGVRQFRLFFAIMLAGICFIGQSATLSRSDWLAIAFSIFMILFLLPRGKRFGKALKFALVAPLLAVFVWLGILAADRITGFDFQRKMVDRVKSMLPSERETSKTVKAWDSRWDSAVRELELWLERPITGQGFGHRFISTESGQNLGGYGHNTWTYILFSAGPAGFAATCVVVFGSWIIGRRMIRDANGEKTFTLMGALAGCSATFIAMHGLATASFNTPRPAIFLGLTFGVVARARAMQLELIRQQHELDAYYAEYGYPQEEYEPQAYVDEQPIFGNWYQPN